MGCYSLPPLKEISFRYFEERGALRKQGTDTMNTFTGKIGNLDEWNKNSLSL
jgi:hypothetical protein